MEKFRETEQNFLVQFIKEVSFQFMISLRGSDENRINQKQML